MRHELDDRSWVRFPSDPALTRWVAAALPAARAGLAEIAASLRCGGTWDVGLEALPNDESGAVSGVALAGVAIEAAQCLAGRLKLHHAQVSTVFPGYPRPWEAESDAAYRYRRDRDAAHVDGLLPIGPDRRRMIREPHAWILGLPLTPTDPGASPPVIWEGSHRIMARALAEALSPFPQRDWPDTDVTEAYHAARRDVFATCKRTVLHAEPGEAILIHRLALHGISPWVVGAKAPPEGRMIAYFRPDLPGGIADWLGH